MRSAASAMSQKTDDGADRTGAHCAERFGILRHVRITGELLLVAVAETRAALRDRLGAILGDRDALRNACTSLSSRPRAGGLVGTPVSGFP